MDRVDVLSNGLSDWMSHGGQMSGMFCWTLRAATRCCSMEKWDKC